ncbi:MAG: phage tail sheath family protein [Sphingomonadales bacterium]|nr:phage tail sheath family protein [Sphingomonadales bacterium]MBD3775029.1 phage tail sheath family protein [Paracoccaceae bacterium]
MPEYSHPGIYVVEQPGPRPVMGARTDGVLLLGLADEGPDAPLDVTSLQQFRSAFGTVQSLLADAVDGFFTNGGRRATILRLASDSADDFNAALDVATGLRGISLVAAPGVVDPTRQQLLARHCEDQRFRFAVLDCPLDAAPDDCNPQALLGGMGHAAAYYPWLEVDGGGGTRRQVPPSGHVLGCYATTDYRRGVWKAPANEPLVGVIGVTHATTTEQAGALVARSVNPIRQLPQRGIRIWGARTLSDNPEWRYVPVRRLAIHIEQSLSDGMGWVVFEPNDATLWAAIRQSADGFLHELWRNGALTGTRPQDAYFVACDATTTSAADIDNGVTNCMIGFAPLRPAEFIVLTLSWAHA